MASSLLASNERLHSYVKAAQPPEHEELRALRQRTSTMPTARFQIAPEQGHFLAFLVRLLSARRVLEVGTFTGYSALTFALALPDDGRVLTCDINADWAAVGLPYWKRAAVDHKIEVRLGPARDTLAGLKNEYAAGFDLVFIDGNKDEYECYYEAALELVRFGGLIALDNMLQGGRVAEPDNIEPRTVAIRKLNEKIAADGRVDRVLISVGDGMTLARRQR